jgi:hypothetical protein
VKLAALAGFTALAFFSGRDLLSDRVRHTGPLAVLAVIGGVVAPLLGTIFVEVGQPSWIVALGLVGVFCQSVAVFYATRQDLDHPRSAFTVTGLASFSAAVALGFLAIRGEELHPSLNCVAALVPILGSAVLEGALGIRRSLGREGNASLPGWQTAATAVGGVGLLVILAALPLAWPSTSALLAAALLAGLLLSALAYRFVVPGLHIAALANLSLAAVLGFHWLAANLPTVHLASLLVGGPSGLVLACGATAIALADEWLVRKGRLDDARMYGFTAVLIAVFGLLSVTAAGIARPQIAAATA